MYITFCVTKKIIKINFSDSLTRADAELLETKEIKGHFIKVEPSIICHDGESIQVSKYERSSHTCARAHVYMTNRH